MPSAITDLKPKLLWHYFYALTQIPRPSHQEDAVQQFVLDEAKRLGLWAERDAVGNVLVRKPASPGMENPPGVILQNHLDMVAQKNEDSNHNFSTDPIDAYIDPERDNQWVTAKGTTLGADNGIGVASALAVLASNDIQHGPLEALFTATEETGMDGAKGLQPNWIQGQLLLNLDTEELGDICIGCAGGVDATFTLPISWQAPTTHKAYQLSVKGLKGGHSGIDIIKQRGNAAFIMTRLLDSVNKYIEVAAIDAGNLRNAIPREAQAVFGSDLDKSKLNQFIEKEAEVIRRGLPTEDRGISVILKTADIPEQVWDNSTQNTILTAIRVCPNGVDRMSMDTQGVVETSVNLAKIETQQNHLELQHLLRSLDDAARDDLADRMSRLFQAFGASVQLDGAYPGWQPAPHSALTDCVIKSGQEVLGFEPNVTVIHAGLECGLLGQNYPHWQMISFGPTIEMPHSPDERVNIESVEKFWDWLRHVLTSLQTL
ncbi:aminoacyl-histidine dipeptidase [Psychrobacter lutiphocae]|uniref:aminoacyl-histidine dipeptidase n=1 Tax=Psychrobacter lutiphocae TaxID=540500 RepID=UPI000366EC71|nr:aminoacyl-histidine dipeptidase [Psychrobacter lutiphocae]